METRDALIVGGGPAGSTCAWKLRQAGLDIVVIDAAVFPRDKVCAGWITPQVVAELKVDVDEYRRGRTFQPITGFRVGLIGGRGETQTDYGRPVSFGIRRCEFDQYLLQRSDARLKLGTPVTSIRRNAGQWTVNDTVRAPLLIGAGGHFCPVARSINGASVAVPVIVAQEAEVPLDAIGGSAATEREVPELYFCRDLNGYGWCIRKGEYVNIGLGRIDHRSLPAATSEFLAFLEARRRISLPRSWRWRGHAYAAYGTPHRRVVDEGVMLLGDAAGLADPRSGEGIGPAVESGLLGAATIVEANGRYSSDRLRPYEAELRARFGTGPGAPWCAPAGIMATRFGLALGRHLLRTPAFVRHVVLDRWFLHRHELVSWLST